MNVIRIYIVGLLTITSLVMQAITPDPHSEGYYSISPYAYCAGNPIRYIDPNGKDIAVLNVRNGMHMAMLIQNSEKKWEYYSLNGDKIYSVTSGSVGGNMDHNIGREVFDSPQAFLDSKFNMVGTKEQKESDITSGYLYDEAFLIKTTPEQDLIMKEMFKSVVVEDYNIMNNHCSHAVQKTLQAVGINKYEENITPPMTLYRIVEDYINNIPSNAFDAIIKGNPSGILLRK